MTDRYQIYAKVLEMSRHDCPKVGKSLVNIVVRQSENHLTTHEERGILRCA